MSGRVVFCLSAVLCVVAQVGSVPRAQGTQIAPPPAASVIPEAGADLSRYCITCHNSRANTGGLSLEGLDLGEIPARADVWEKVLVKLRTGAMPPAGHAAAGSCRPTIG